MILETFRRGIYQADIEYWTDPDIEGRYRIEYKRETRYRVSRRSEFVTSMTAAIKVARQWVNQ